MQFSQILNQLMIEQDITAYRLSKDTGISDSLLGYWKKGEKLPGAENLVKVADYFDCSVDYLLGRTDKPEVNH